MTLETCKKRLELATTPEEKDFWTKRIERKLKLPKYQGVKDEKPKGRTR